MSEYADNFERASKLVQAYILSQEVVYKDLNDLFGEEAWTANFFGFSLNQLTHPEVVKQLDRILDIGGNEQRPFNTALARINALYTKLCMACGESFVSEMEENCIRSLMNMIDPERNPRRNVYKNFTKIFHKYPVLVVAALGNDFFSVERMNFLHKAKVQSPRSGSAR